MIRRSLLAKVYLYALAAFLCFVPLTFFLSHLLVERGHDAEMRAMALDQAGFIGRELERTFHDGRPDPQHQQELAQALHQRIDFTPWGPGGRYPAALASQKLLDEPPRGPRVRPGPPHADRWVRLDVGGRPVGAIEVRFQPPKFRRGPGPGWPIVIGWLALLTLAVLPPLVFWVLRPLRAMVAAAERLGRGDLETPVPVRRTDEFGTLERAFEGLRARIQDMLAQRERLLTDISHEIRGPLARMNLVVPLLRQAGAPVALADLLEREIADVDAMLGGVLDYVRGRKARGLALERHDLAELATELVERRHLVVDDHDQRLAAIIAPAPVMGDRALLLRAMGNLLDNALKYTPAGGTIRVEVGSEAGQGFFRVVDDGPGIPAADLPHVFEPFYRPDTSRSRETGGSGLGLSIVKAVADSHGGDATVASVEGQGTRAELRLPLAAPADGAAPAAREDVRPL